MEKKKKYETPTIDIIIIDEKDIITDSALLNAGLLGEIGDEEEKEFF